MRITGEGLRWFADVFLFLVSVWFKLVVISKPTFDDSIYSGEKLFQLSLLTQDISVTYSGRLGAFLRYYIIAVVDIVSWCFAT